MGAGAWAIAGLLRAAYEDLRSGQQLLEAHGGAAGAEQRAGWRLADAAGRLQRERRRVAVRMRWSGLAWWL
jgi:hypothetical protein